MIALHLRDSPVHLIAPSQPAGSGIPVSFGGSSFHGHAPLRAERPLLLISATSIGSGVIHLLMFFILKFKSRHVNCFCDFIQKHENYYQGTQFKHYKSPVYCTLPGLVQSAHAHL